MIKAIVFDVGGVVMNKAKLNHINKHFAKVTGISESLFDPLVHKYWDMWKIDAINEEEFYDGIIKELGIKQDYKKKMKIDESKINYADQKIVSMIKKLRKRYKTIALTNNVREWFEDAIIDYDFLGLFDHIIPSYEVKKAKPDREIYEIMLKKAELRPDECVFIDDQGENLAIPKKMGMKVIHYRNYRQCFEELRSLGVEI
jgi:epoxide hydrolase-like predicted phosphatase